MKMQIWILLALLPPGAIGAEPPAFEERFSRVRADGLPDGWRLWSPAPDRQLGTRPSASRFEFAGTGNRDAKSRLSRAISGLKSRAWYRFDVTYSASGVVTPENQVLAVVQWVSERRMRVLVPETRTSDDTKLSLTMQIPDEAKGTVNLHLFAGFLDKGVVTWRAARVTYLPDYTPPRRPVRVAVIDSQPAREGTSEQSARHYAAEIDHACSGPQKPDILVLPENFNRSQVVGEFTVALDSPYVRTIAGAVRRNRVYLAGSIRAAHHGAVFNTAILLDRQGRLAGSYNKSHLTVGEMVFSDLSRGDDFPVFETDFGKIGIPICFDFHFPEVARMMALRGAELLLVPMAADARLKEDGIQRGAEHSGKAFVVENRIPVVFSATLGSSLQPSLIIDQHGKVLARSSDDRHIIQATLDLAAKEYQWSGDDFQSVYVVGRRPELYRGLATK